MVKKRANGEGSVYKRKDGKWVGQITVGRYDDGRLKRKTVYGNVKKEVNQKLNEIQNQINTGKFIDKNDITLSEWMYSWLNKRENSISEKTWNCYESIIRCHIIPPFNNWQGGKIKLQNLTTGNIQNLINDKFKNGRMTKEKKTKPELSTRTIEYIHLTLNLALKQAVKEKEIYDNPAEYVELPQDNKEKQYITLSLEELKNFFKTIKDDKFFTLIFLAIRTGLRRGEILGLKWSDINFETGILNVNQQVKSEKGNLILSNKLKSKKSKRPIVLDQFTLQLLLKHKEEQNKKQIKNEINNELNLMFCKEDGQLINPLYFTKYFGKLLKKHNLKHIRLHDLRHTFATISLEIGIPHKVVQEMLGHVDIGTTMNAYSHVTLDIQKIASDKLGEIFKGAVDI